MQSFGIQLWDTALSLQVMLASHDIDDDEIIRNQGSSKDTITWKDLSLHKTPLGLGDHRKMLKDIAKGGWTFSEQDQGWPVSDCTAESLEVRIHN